MCLPYERPNWWDGYAWFQDLKDCYGALYDEISKIIFDARVKTDLFFHPQYVDSMIEVCRQFKSGYLKLNILQDAAKTKKPIVIYGAGRYGKKWAEYLRSISANLTGFFDQNYETMTSCMGLPVLPPPENALKYREFLILITAAQSLDSIYYSLKRLGFSEEQLLSIIQNIEEDFEHQYFDFPEKYPKGGAFVDAGCFNCDTSLRFAHWCGGQYSKIFAFEPDAENLERCKLAAQKHGLPNISFYQAGLYDHNGTASFDSRGTSSSMIAQGGDVEISLVTLDEIVGNTTVSFIKMDIEGSELPALRGAAKTIRRDKPLCAISAYHRPGDVIVLMQYLKSLVPEYQFALRHYSNIDTETVLYAFL